MPVTILILVFAWYIWLGFHRPKSCTSPFAFAISVKKGLVIRAHLLVCAVFDSTLFWQSILKPCQQISTRLFSTNVLSSQHEVSFFFFFFKRNNHITVINLKFSAWGWNWVVGRMWKVSGFSSRTGLAFTAYQEKLEHEGVPSGTSTCHRSGACTRVHPFTNLIVTSIPQTDKDAQKSTCFFEVDSDCEGCINDS